MKIAVAGTGYVGLSIATLLAQHNKVKAVDIIPEKVDLINRLFPSNERQGVNATRLVVKALQLHIIDLDNLKPDNE